MHNANDLVRLMKQAAVEAVETGSPSGLYFGTVESVSPIAVRVEPKKVLGAAQLVLSTLVQDFDVEMTVDHETEDAEGPQTHKHPYKGRKVFTVHLGLKAGEKVLLVREQGGQKYVVFDRVRA